MSRRMRCAFLSTYPPTRCGIGRYASFLVNALLKNSPSLEIFILTDYEVNYNTTSGITTIPCFKAAQFVVDEVVNRLNDLKPDILHIQHHYGIFGFEDDFLNLLSRYATVVTMHEVHTEEFPEKIALSYDIGNLQRNHGILGKLAKRIIVHSGTIKQSLIDLGVSAEKIVVIPHGTLFIPKVKREVALSTFGLPQDARVLLSFGFVRRDKNERILLEVFTEILKEVPNAYLVMAGFVHPLTEEQDRMVAKERRELSRKLSIKNVRFIEEFIPDDRLPYLFSMADLFVSLYDQRYREISGALHVGIGAGLPCVVFRVPRYEEIEGISPETVVEVGNKQDLVRVIIRLLRNEELKRQVARSVRTYGEETSWDKISILHHQVYREIIEGKEIAKQTSPNSG